MDMVDALLRQLGQAALQLVLQPYYYIAVLFLIFQYSRQIRLERQMFAVRLHMWPRLLGKALMMGLAAGAVMSVAGVFIGASLTSEALIWLWAAAAVLMLVRVRYLCFAYGAGLLALLQWILGWTGLDSQSGTVGEMAESLAGIDMPGLLMLVALLHLIEALLVRRGGDKLATPLFLEGKRGKLVGGYMLQGFWPVPLLMLVPGGEETASLPWTPLLGGDWSGGWSIVALPMIIGFSELTRSMLPADKAKHAAKGLLLYSICVAAFAALAAYVPELLPLAAVCSLVLHEAIIWRSRAVESARSPLYVNDARGLRILGIVPGTPAAAMELKAGEILHKVNGRRIRTKEDLHAALHENPAFCKLEVLNHDGELKFAQRARYAGEHHQLGVILAPDEQATYYVSAGPGSLLELFSRKRTASRRERSSAVSAGD
ncbi:PDZ domain-containing protein [Paenibacillus protaetiae]|uniref:PDZ domain-containing protein n=1 Tax=Paenibacillus protaetiae TaxID=2509456 RepID=A0A4P6EXK2_9BACL|nr:PDZ domain-containing protein [Paenibacillus protaetiae]QAY67804.1 PDZ domain-containing protein [Paenibacillus protaetiae]